MISFINEILDLIIKISIIFGISLLCYFYWKIKNLDIKIEKLNKEFEKKRGEIRLQTIEMHFIDSQTANEKRKFDETIAPLERERLRLLSKIPFIK